MPTYEELVATSVAVDFPIALTHGIVPADFLRYDLQFLAAWQRSRLSADHYEAADGCCRLQSVINALESSFRLVSEKGANDLTIDARISPYSKVPDHSNYHSLFIC